MLNTTEFHYFGLFYISQGSVATCVRCGKKCDNNFIANFLLNLAVGEFEKINQHLPKVCLRPDWHVFLTHTVVI